MNENLSKELKAIGLRSVFLNISACIIFFLITGVNISVPIGLLLGTVLMFIYLILLYKSIEVSLSGRESSAKLKMNIGYFLRLAVIGIFFVASLQTDYINSVAVLIPIFYPKIIYVGGALFKRKGGV
ncbi:MAG: ATP synthase subunit I [Oscillospiraceae bacterium]